MATRTGRSHWGSAETMAELGQILPNSWLGAHSYPDTPRVSAVNQFLISVLDAMPILATLSLGSKELPGP